MRCPRSHATRAMSASRRHADSLASLHAEQRPDDIVLLRRPAASRGITDRQSWMVLTRSFRLLGAGGGTGLGDGGGQPECRLPSVSQGMMATDTGQPSLSARFQQTAYAAARHLSRFRDLCNGATTTIGAKLQNGQPGRRLLAFASILKMYPLAICVNAHRVLRTVQPSSDLRDRHALGKPCAQLKVITLAPGWFHRSKGSGRCNRFRDNPRHENGAGSKALNHRKTFIPGGPTLGRN